MRRRWHVLAAVAVLATTAAAAAPAATAPAATAPAATAPAATAPGATPPAPPPPQTVAAFGTATAVPAATVPTGSASLVALAPTPDGHGYWVVTATGQVLTAGDATFEGDIPGVPVVSLASTPDGHGYWLAASDGGVDSFGDALFHGSAPGFPAVVMVATPDGGGYWLASGDGRVLPFGDAAPHGQHPPLTEPVVGMAATPDGGGYWLVAADGGVFAYGDAAFYGAAAHPAQPIVAMAATADGHGYWLLGADGGVFAFGDAPFAGSAAGAGPVAAPATAIAGTSGGYWIGFGHYPLGPDVAAFVAGRQDNVTAAVYDITTGETFTFRPGVVENTASTLKLDILETLLQDAQAAGRSLTPAEESETVPMIEQSDNDSADALWDEVGAAPGVARLESNIGMISTTPAADNIWGTTTTTALDRVAAVRAVALPNRVLTDASRQYALNLMEHITPSQYWGATGGVPANVTVALKNGFAIIDGWQINTEGWVEGDGRDYLIAVLTNDNAGEVYGIQTVDQVSAFVWNALAG